jgi:hypothetical protein
MATIPSNYDYDSETTSLDRRQKMLEALMAASQAPMEMPTAGGKVSPYAALAKILNGVNARHGLQQIESKRSELGSRYQTDLQEGMSNFINTKDGIDEMRPSMALKPNEDGSMQQVPVKVAGDPKRAMLEAIASNHPVLQKLGMSMATAKPEKDPNALSANTALAHFDPQSVAMNPNDPSKWAKKKDIRTVEGNFFDVGDDRAKQLPGGVSYSDPLNLPGVGVVQGNNVTGKLGVLDQAPRTNVTLNNAGPAAGKSAFYKNAAEKVDALGKLAGAAQDNLGTLAELSNLDKKGVFSNVSSGPATFFANLGQAAGVPVDTRKLGNTETFNALTTDLWQGLVSKYGGNRGVTKEEAIEIKQMLPLAGKSPEARQQLYTILGNVAKRQIAQYESANSAFANSANEDDPRIFAEGSKNTYLPQPGSTQPALPVSAPALGTKENPMSLDDYLKQQRGQ